MKARYEKLKNRFSELFGGAPEAFIQSPGRVDLLGIHTDYNDGFVLPIAVDLNVAACGRKTDGNKIRIHSVNKNETAEFCADDIRKDEVCFWSNYCRGVVKYLAEAGAVFGGADIVLQSTVPIGSGLSSSAALENATGVMLQTLYGFEMSGKDMALVGQKAENRFVGVSTGIMDQFVSRNGKKDHALFLDCRTLEHKQLPLDCSRYKIVVCNTMKERGLVDSEYGARRAQCEEAVAVLQAHYPRVKALRDADMEMIEKHKGELTEKQYMRARHVISENERGLKAIEVLRAGDYEAFGRLMDRSHDSARDDYEVSGPELEAMVGISRRAPGALSGRLAGAGFAGCTVSLVEAASADAFSEYVKREYAAVCGVVPELWVCSAENGAGRLSEEELN